MSQSFGEHLSEKMREINPKGVPHAVGISWFSRKTYDTCVQMFDDSEGFHDTYEEWFQVADKTVKDLKIQGFQVVKAKIDPVEFPKWCRDNGFTKLDKEARTRFGNAMAMLSLQGTEQ